MKLEFRDQKIELDREPSAEIIIEKINYWLGSIYFFSHLVADGEIIYENPESYLLENNKDINVLEVVGLTPNEFVNEVLLTAESYLKGTSKELQILTEGFYNVPNNKDWQSFNDLLEGLQWINQVISSINEMEEKPSNWESYLTISKSLTLEIGSLEEATTNGDFVLMADIIQYEIKPAYESLEKEISITIDVEGRRHDVN